MFFVTSPEKNRVGTSLFFLFIFPDFTKKHNRCVVLTKRGLFGLFTYKTECMSFVKAFHRINLNQNKCLNSNTASNMTAKVAKPIKMTANRVIEFHFFFECQ